MNWVNTSVAFPGGKLRPAGLPAPLSSKPTLAQIYGRPKPPTASPPADAGDGWANFGTAPPTGAPGTVQPTTPYWQPTEFRRPATPYPGQGSGAAMTNTQKAAARRLSGMYGGGGGGGMMTGVYVPPEHSLGPGAYWPGHSAERQKQLTDSFQSPWTAAALGNTTALHAMQAAQRANGNRPVSNWGALFGGYGGGMSGGGLGGAYQSAYNEAKAENEARYRDILGGYHNRYTRNMDMLRQRGEQEAADINEQYDKTGAAGRQNLVGRGLGNSTIVDTMEAGNERERASSQGRLQSQLRTEYLNADQALSGDTLQFMERRNDTYPDYNQLAQLAQQLGQAGYGAGGVMAGGGGADYLPAGEAGYVNPLMFMGGGFGGLAAGYGGGGGGLNPRQQMLLAANGGLTRDQQFAQQNAFKNSFRQNNPNAISGGSWAAYLAQQAAATPTGPLQGQQAVDYLTLPRSVYNDFYGI